MLMISPSLKYCEIARALTARFLSRKRLSVGWILCGDERVGSSRIHGLNLHRYLLRSGVRSVLINQPVGYVESLDVCDLEIKAILQCGFDVVIFQRVYLGRTLKLIQMLKKKHATTLFFVADLYESEVYNQVDYIFTVSNSLKEALVNRGVSEKTIYVVPDAIETGFELYKSYHHLPQSEIKLVWVGAKGHWHTLGKLRALLEQDERLKCFRLVTISNHPDADVQWSLETVWAEILKCDVGIVPVDVGQPESIVKSNNRVTMFKALGIPVICSRLPSYEEAIVNGVSGYFADSIEDWANVLLALVDSRTRQRIGYSGRQETFDRYGIERIGRDFLDIMYSLRRNGGVRE